MPKSITFFSRGKTPIYVNYVIAHNTRGAPVSICKNPVITDLPERARHVRAPTEKGLSHMQQPLFPHYSTMPRRSGTMVN